MIESSILIPTYRTNHISFTLKKSTPYHLVSMDLKEILTIIPQLYKDKSILSIYPFID